MHYMSVGEAASRLGANPRDITNLFYSRKLSGDGCPIIGGRRLIPFDYLEIIRWALRKDGKPVGRIAREVSNASR